MTPISFTARYIRPANIQKLDGDSYKPHAASLVEMELSDRSAIERVSYDWMQNVSDQIAKESDNIGKDGTHYYAITNQADHFEKLDPNKIRGMMVIKEGGAKKTHNTLEFLQVSPSDMSENYGDKLNRMMNKFLNKIFKAKKPEHKHVGQALLDTAKDMFSEKPIDLFAVDKAVEFYEKNGFKKLSGFKNRILNRMEWVKP